MDVCGRCYQLDFDGTGHYNAADPGSVALKGKTMIVQATNIGFDVGGGQFDILTPGGGVGLFDACSYQWGVETVKLGAVNGGFMTKCQEQGGDHQKLKECVLGRCAAVFDDPGLAELKAGCEWYVNWYQVADNPNLHYQEVACPPAVAVSGIDRGPLDDIMACDGGGGGCSQQEMDMCDCAWTDGGKNCGQDDGRAAGRRAARRVARMGAGGRRGDRYTGPVCRCVYPCTTDADCADGAACLCAIGYVTMSECRPADCRTDADCDGFECGLSLTVCDRPTGLFCRSKGDECKSDQDCTDPNGGDLCRFDLKAQIWRFEYSFRCP